MQISLIVSWLYQLDNKYRGVIHRMDITKIHFEDYKCFPKTTIENLQPINVVIGKNNIGKSSLLDVVEIIYDGDKLKNYNGNIFLEKKLLESEIAMVFSRTTFGGIIAGNHYEFGRRFIGSDFIFEI